LEGSLRRHEPTRGQKRLKELEKENARLKRLLAEKELDIDMLKEVSRGNF
jgi:putative transposase